MDTIELESSEISNMILSKNELTEILDGLETINSKNTKMIMIKIIRLNR